MLVIFAWPAALVLGVPAYLAMRRRMWTAWWIPAVASGGVAAVIGVISFLLNGLDQGKFVPYSILVGVAFGVLGFALGAVGGLVFWLMAAAGESREPRVMPAPASDAWPRISCGQLPQSFARSLRRSISPRSWDFDRILIHTNDWWQIVLVGLFWVVWQCVAVVIQLFRWPFIRHIPFAEIRSDAFTVNGRTYSFRDIAAVHLAPNRKYLLLDAADPGRVTQRWKARLGDPHLKIEVPLRGLAGDPHVFADCVRMHWERSRMAAA